MRKISLDTPDATTLGCITSRVYRNHLHNLVIYRLGYRGNFLWQESAFSLGILVFFGGNLGAEASPAKPSRAGSRRISSENYILWGMGRRRRRKKKSPVQRDAIYIFSGMRKIATAMAG